MKILVYVKDGRTVYLLQRRGELARLVGVDPWGEHASVHAVRGIWDSTTRSYVWTRVRLRFLNKASISSVEEAPGGISETVARDAAAE